MLNKSEQELDKHQKQLRIVLLGMEEEYNLILDWRLKILQNKENKMQHQRFQNKIRLDMANSLTDQKLVDNSSMNKDYRHLERLWKIQDYKNKQKRPEHLKLMMDKVCSCLN
jgi:hypothetical protein